MSDLSPHVIPAETPAPKFLSGPRTVLRDVMSRPSGAIGPKPCGVPRAIGADQPAVCAV